MSNYQTCPKCGDEIDAVKASLRDECYECGTGFSDLLEEPNDPEESGPYYEVDQ